MLLVYLTMVVAETADDDLEVMSGNMRDLDANFFLSLSDLLLCT